MDPEVDYEHLSDKSEGFSGADIAAVCKMAGKQAIRTKIGEERRKWEECEAKKKTALDKGGEYHEEEEAKTEEACAVSQFP